MGREVGEPCHRLRGHEWRSHVGVLRLGRVLGGDMGAKVTNCTACGKVADCDVYHVIGYRDETCSNETVNWVGYLCDECEDRLLAVLDGKMEER